MHRFFLFYAFVYSHFYIPCLYITQFPRLSFYFLCMHCYYYTFSFSVIYLTASAAAASSVNI